jgi:hypothetical protein
VGIFSLTSAPTLRLLVEVSGSNEGKEPLEASFCSEGELVGSSPGLLNGAQQNAKRATVKELKPIVR